MRGLSFRLLAAAALFAATPEPGAAAGPGGGIAQLRERAEREGSVRIIVRVDAAVRLEAELSGPAARLAQRRAIWRAQDRLLGELGGADYRRLRRFHRLPFVAMEVTPRALAALERSGRVTRIDEDRLLAPHLFESVPLIQADLAAQNGFDGSGRVVAVIDTGVDSSHSFLAGALVDEACFSALGDCPDGSTAQTGPGSGAHCGFSIGCFHGTHVAGIALGSGATLNGVAPASSLVSLRVFSEFTGAACADAGEDPCALAFNSDIVSALEHVLDLSATLPIDSVNMSLGGGSWTDQASCDADNSAFKMAIDDLRAAGIASVVSSGNDGFLFAMGAPACVSSAVSVGATNDLDQIAIFSNSAPFLSLLAPGVDIVSAVPFSLLGFSFGETDGTSMAAPHVAGAWATLREAVPSASVDDVLSALQTTGVPITDVQGTTTPRIQIWPAVQALQCSAGPDFDADGIADSCDNCIEHVNADQVDDDGDGYGDVCDADFDNDGWVGGPDYAVLGRFFSLGCADPGFAPHVDMDGDCVIGGSDAAIFSSLFWAPPGPSGLAP